MQLTFDSSQLDLPVTITFTQMDPTFFYGCVSAHFDDEGGNVFMEKLSELKEAAENDSERMILYQFRASLAATLCASKVSDCKLSDLLDYCKAVAEGMTRRNNTPETLSIIITNPATPQVGGPLR